MIHGMLGRSVARAAWLAGLLSLGCTASDLDSLASGSRPTPDAGIDSGISSGSGGQGVGGGGGATSSGGATGTGATAATSGGAPGDSGSVGGEPCPVEGAFSCVGYAQKQRLECVGGIWQAA